MEYPRVYRSKQVRITEAICHFLTAESACESTVVFVAVDPAVILHFLYCIVRTTY